jgi:hypothetical protein
MNRRDDPKRQIQITTWTDLVIFVAFVGLLNASDIVIFTYRIAEINFALSVTLLIFFGTLSVIRAPNSKTRHVGFAAIAIAIFAIIAALCWRLGN